MVDETKHDEPPRSPRPQTPSTDWEVQLVGLLGQLEFQRGRLEGRKLQEDCSFLLDEMSKMLQLTDEFTQRAQFIDLSSHELTTCLARAGAFATSVSALAAKQPKGLMKSMWASMTGKPSVPAQSIRDCLESGVMALQSYFALFTTRFPSSLNARRWVDAASSFLAEMQTTIRELAD